jgi:hypothetical protein
LIGGLLLRHGNFFITQVKRTPLLLLALLLLSYLLQAQPRARDADPKVLFGGEKIDVSGFGGAVVEFGSIDGSAAIVNGGAGAALFNRSLFLGGYGLSLSNSIQNTDIQTGISREVDFAHGGVYAGYVFFPHKLVHFGVSSKVGWGVLRLSPENAFLSSVSPVSDNLLVFTPQLEAEVNLSYWFKVNAGLGYRTVAGVDNSFYSQRALSSPSFTLSFLFGWFK